MSLPETGPKANTQDVMYIYALTDKYFRDRCV